MRFGAAFWVNRTSWPDLLAASRAVEAAGWDSLWIDDHLLAAADRVFTVVATLLAGGVQLLEAKIEQLETARPMARRRSRR